ncbi:MAG: hypothetical protein F2923_06950, partial [Actinobacteria bacterium]|nr:hypothetical protein [Actinomycetota bacterium]
MRRSALILAPIFLLLAACSSATDTSTSTAPTAQPSTSGQFVTSDCGVVGGNPTTASAPPMQGVTMSGVTVQRGQTPQVTITPGLPAATQVETKTLKAGRGQVLKATDTLTFNYCGVGMVSQTQFDSSWANGAPITYGLADLIPGWSVGMPGMKIGEQRLLIIPGAQGYGSTPPAGSGI